MAVMQVMTVMKATELNRQATTAEATTSTIDDVVDDGDANTDDQPTDQARWTFLFFINGDNNLEEWVVPELNYLEEVGSGHGVHIVVQADRIPGYATDDGDWTETRRYYITADSNTKKVSSKVVEHLGELDMGASETLSDFLLWARKEYPAERTVLVFWDHGDSWYGDQVSPPPTTRTVSDDETSNSSLSIAQGDVNEGLATSVQRSGPIELIVFDACFMASWEVAHSLQGYARYIAASEATMGEVGLYYVDAIRMVRDDPLVDAAALADSMAAKSVGHGEQTYSAVTIDALGQVSSAVDQLARAVLADDSLVQPLLQARTNARGLSTKWKDWYLDLNDLGAKLCDSDDARLHSHGQAIQAGIETAVVGAYGNNSYPWAGGLTIMFDTSDKQSLGRYTNGAGATWSQDTKWGELLLHLADR